MALAEREDKVQRNGRTNSYNDKRNSTSEKHGQVPFMNHTQDFCRFANWFLEIGFDGPL